MHWRTTLVLLLATVGIGAYVSLYELKQPTSEERERRSKRIVSLRRESVTGLELALPAGTVSLDYDGTAWRIIPSGARAYEEVINGILRHTNPLRAVRILPASPEQPVDRAAYGLEPPVGRLRLLADGAPITLFIGETTPVTMNRYLQVEGRPEVFIIPPGLFDDANRPPEEFRDPRLLGFHAWAVDTLTLAVADPPLALQREDDRWQLTAPLADPADRHEVSKLLTRVADLRVARVIDDAPTPERLAEADIDAAAVITVALQGDPPASIAVTVGATLPDDAALRYAVRSDEPSLYAVPIADLDGLQPSPHGLRAKACFDFFTNLVNRIALTHADGAVSLERVDGRWREATTGTAVEGAAVEDLLRMLADLRLSGFVEDAPADLTPYGLEPPEHTIAVWTTDREAPQRLLIGSRLEESTNRYGRIAGRDSVVRLPEFVDELLAISFD